MVKVGESVEVGGASEGTGIPPASGEPVVFEQVVKAYPQTERPALAGVDLHVAAGEFAFVVGASGSGKSTLIRLALREELPTSGTITVAGRELVRMKRRHVPALRREIGVVFQDFRLLADKTVWQNVAYVLHVLGERPDIVRRRVPEVLDMVGLASLSERRPHELSGGEQQRVAIARAVVKNPPVVLADEPTGNLDPVTSVDILSVLQQINSLGTTVLMATHDRDLVDRVRGRVVELDAGRVVRDERGGGYAPSTEWPTVAGRPGEAEPARGSGSSAAPAPMTKEN